MSSENEAFGELRALMNASTREHIWWRELQELLADALERDVEVVRDRWVPYIRGFDEIWAKRFGFRRATTIEEFERWSVAFMGMAFELYLFDQRVGDEAVEELMGKQLARRIVELNLGRCDLTARGYEALAESEHLTGLERLTLASNTPGGRGARALARLARLSDLERLQLFGNGLDDVDIAHIIESLDDADMTHLDLTMNTAGPATARALSGSEGLASLERLRLDDTALGDDHALTLGRAPRLASLELLALRRCGITARGALALIEGLEVPALRWLDLTGNTISARQDGPLLAAARERGFEVTLRRVEYTDWR